MLIAVQLSRRYVGFTADKNNEILTRQLQFTELVELICCLFLSLQGHVSPVGI